ncbi:MAG: hypothetical protein ACRDCA_26960 [Serratia sp. (in: enterobacteria)]|uniref:hypothetical protein n=1 Tax=Serratia sp. (in: enterobacteria) TaxID=616 RepID=UPI003F3F3D67
MKKIKRVNGLLLESGFTKREIRKITENAKTFDLDIMYSVRDIGKRTIRAGLILAVILIIFTTGTVLKDGFFGFGIIVLMILMVIIPAYYLTPLRLYIKSALFYLKDR